MLSTKSQGDNCSACDENIVAEVYYDFASMVEVVGTECIDISFLWQISPAFTLKLVSLFFPTKRWQSCPNRLTNTDGTVWLPSSSDEWLSFGNSVSNLSSPARLWRPIPTICAMVIKTSLSFFSAASSNSISTVVATVPKHWITT